MGVWRAEVVTKFVRDDENVPVLRVVVDERSRKIAVKVCGDAVRARARACLLPRRAKTRQIRNATAERSSGEEMCQIARHGNHRGIPD